MTYAEPIQKRDYTQLTSKSFAKLSYFAIDKFLYRRFQYSFQSQNIIVFTAFTANLPSHSPDIFSDILQMAGLVIILVSNLFCRFRLTELSLYVPEYIFSSARFVTTRETERKIYI